MEVDFHLEKRSITGGVDDCGDTGLIRVYSNRCFMALLDALGNGKGACGTAGQAEAYLSSRYTHDLIELLNGLHENLKGTRGVVAAFCRLNLDSGILNYTGMGNISMKILGPRYRRLVTQDGVIGYRMRFLKQQQTQLYPGDILLMSSDGIKEHFDPAHHPTLFKGNAKDICLSVMGKLKKAHGDASCIVLRYGI